MSFPDKVEREKCWSSRDVLWKCLDENPEKHEVCAEFRKLYESTCPSQWVKHFDRKREYLKFKDRIQNEGSRPISLGENEGFVGISKKSVPAKVSEEAEAGASSSPTRIFRKFQPPTFS